MVHEVVRVLESHGWRRVAADGSCCQLRHDSRPGAITIVGKPEVTLPTGVLRSLWRCAQIEEPA